jgi:hypothetical protein
MKGGKKMASNSRKGSGRKTGPKTKNVKARKVAAYTPFIEEIITPPAIWITLEAKRVLDAYVKLCGQEISGLGKVTQLEGNRFLIEELYLFEQTVSAAKTDLSQDAIHDFLFEMDDRGLDPGVLKIWWHSHVNGTVFWSPQDKDTIRRIGAGEYMISVVANKRGDYLARFDIYRPVRWVWDNLELRVVVPEDDSIDELIAEEIAAKVNQSKVVYCQDYNQGVWQNPATTWGLEMNGAGID